MADPEQRKQEVKPADWLNKGLDGGSEFVALGVGHFVIHDNQVKLARLEGDQSILGALAEQDPRFGYALVLTLFEEVLQRLQATRARLLDLYGSPDDQR